MAGGPMTEFIQSCAMVDLAATIKMLPPAMWMFLERVPSRWLEPAEQADGIRLTAFDPNTDWSPWQRGRVFCKDWELRWEGSHGIFTGPDTKLPGFDKEKI